MRLNVDCIESGDGAAGLVAVVVASPFDRSAADLPIDAASAERLIAEAKATGFTGAIGESVLASGANRWVALIGAGPAAKATSYRRVGSAAVKLAQQVKAGTISVIGANSRSRARFLAEGLALSGYRFDDHITPTEEDRKSQLTGATIVGDDEVKAGTAIGVELAEAVCLARDLGNEHPGRCTPEFLAETARTIAKQHGMEITVFGEDELAKRGFNLLLAVGRGSDEPSRLIHLVYRGAGPIKKRIAIVGKGVTFDSGGYSLKPSDAQINMHLDMGGAAAALGCADAVGRTQPEGVEVHFVVPSVENLVNGNAYKVMEIIRGYSGTTVEIHNTDAEGRLILADALAYITEQKVDEVVDLATLTGACVVALGEETAAVFSNNDDFASRFISSAGAVDEAVWHMPLVDRIEGQLKSSVADTKNIGKRWGGAISAALFLKKFVGDTDWIHVDLAGPAMADAAWEYICKGGTGFGVLALHEYVTRSGNG